MMRKNIIRTLIRSDIHAYSVKVVNGEPQVEKLPIVTCWGKLTNAEAMKAVRDAYGKDIAATVSKVEQTEVIYKVAIDDFVKIATVVECDDEEDEESDD